ncbi:MAG: FAD-binding oxidoreductase [Syntrophorhabdaceae bacterium]|nr:FAD-binding oxidoreductase [Syntrophorhabdaceae bacterium]
MDSQKVNYMIDEKILKELRLILGDDGVSTGQSVRELHSHDESFHTPVLPDVVVFPNSKDDVSRIVRVANDNNIPITPWGVGTSLEGNPIPVDKGICIDFQKMNKVLAIRKEDFQVDVQVGVIYKDLNKILSRYGLFFPPDPGAAATIGGMIGNNASGIRTVKYGATKDCIMKIKVVLADGSVIDVGSRARKSSSGYNLCALFIGSEGTLGIVTEATLRLVGLPGGYTALRAVFPDVINATDTVFQVMSSGLMPAAMEFLDSDVMAVLNKDRGLKLHEMPTLLMEFHGYNEEGLKPELAFVEDICRENRCIFLDKGIGATERARLWEMRHLTFESIKRSHPGLLPLIMDVAVPLSRYSEMVGYIKKEINGLKAYVFGHAGDGNIHVIVMDNPEDRVRWNRVEEINERIVLKALSLEGTCTGEHGVGIGKRHFLKIEHGDSLEFMKRVKKMFDPKGILNPGKFFS